MSENDTQLSTQVILKGGTTLATSMTPDQVLHLYKEALSTEDPTMTLTQQEKGKEFVREEQIKFDSGLVIGIVPVYPKTPKPAVEPAAQNGNGPAKPKRVVSEATKAKMRKAAQARWAARREAATAEATEAVAV